MASTRIRVLVLAALALGGYKVPRASAGDDLAAGTLSGSHYENRLYGFSFDIPDGWQVMPPAEHAKLLSGRTEAFASKSLVLLLLARDDALSWRFVANSQKSLDAMVESLQQISFSR
jgi:hypothetical protein